ncbi:MAG TPA: pyroglutamyl-peptidase I [Acidiphilium sp.]
MRILVTGFEPFGGDTVNPSAMLAEALATETIAGVEIGHAILPCSFAPLGAALDAAMAAFRPDVVLCFGLATGRTGITLERVAINVIDARIPDNLGAQPIDEPVVAGGPAAYFSTLPIKAACARTGEAGVPASISQTAGTFACNAVFYLARHRTEETDIRAGFVHLPCLPEMPEARNGVPSLDFQQMRAAGRAIIQACLECNTDRRIAGGAVA